MEDEQEKQGEETPTADSIEAVAREMGWKDKSEFTDKSGKPFVGAREFILREREFSDRLRDKLVNTESTVKEIKNHFDRQLKVERTKIREELRAAKREAIKEGDADEVDRIEEELKTVETAPTSSTSEEKKLLDEWKSERQWYQQDKDLTDMADALAVRFEGEGMTFPEILEAVGKKMERFINANPSEKKQTASIVEGDTHNSVTTKRHTVRDLTEQQRTILKMYRQEFPKSTDEEYIKQLEEQGVLT